MSATRQRFLIYGFYGEFNAGDEAILYSLLAMLRSKAPRCSIQVACTARREPISKWYESLDVDPFSVRNLWRLLTALVSRRLIIGGGQMIAGDRSLKNLLLCWMMLLINRTLGKRPVLLGVGVEGLARGRAKRLARLIAGAAWRIACRDQQSLDQLLAAGCPPGKLQLTADLVLSGELLGLAPEPAGPTQPTKTILLVLHHSPLRSYAAAEGTTVAYRRVIAQIRQQAPEHSLTVMAHDCRAKFDAGLLDELASLNEDEGVRYVPLDSLPQALGEYSRAALVISVRMHPLIFAALLGRPWLAVGRSNKVAALADRFGAPHAQSLDQVAPLLAKMLNQASSAPQDAALAEARADAWKNIELVVGP